MWPLVIGSAFVQLLHLSAGASAAAPASTVRRVEVNGAQLTLQERGEGEPVVFVHGALGDHRGWAPQLEAFSRRYRAVSYSRRHHHPGSAPDGTQVYDRAVHVADLAGLLRALDAGPAHLVGHSYGGAVAALVALEHPELVRSLVLGEPSVFSLLESPEERSLLAEQKTSLAAVATLAREGEPEVAVREYLKAVVGADVFDRLPPPARVVLMDNARTLAPMLDTYFEPIGLDCGRAGEIRAPVLLVTGELSPPFYAGIIEGLARCLPAARTFVLPGASHGLQMENPEAFGAEVFRFLEEVPRSKGSAADAEP